jgi:hypothetical protein
MGSTRQRTSCRCRFNLPPRVSQLKFQSCAFFLQLAFVTLKLTNAVFKLINDLLFDLDGSVEPLRVNLANIDALGLQFA